MHTRKNVGLKNILFSKFKQYLTKYLDSRVVFAIDMVLSLASSALVFLAVSFFSSSTDFFHSTFALWWAGAAIAGTVAAQCICRFHKIIIRHAQIRDLFALLKYGGLKIAFMLAVIIVSGGIRMSVILALVTDALLTTFLLISVRLAMILVYDRYRDQLNFRRTTKRVLVYGTSDKSIAIHTRLLGSPHYNVMGFVQPGPKHTTMKVSDLPVFSFDGEADAREILGKYTPDFILFASDNEARREKDGLVALCSKENVGILITPSIDELAGDSIMKRYVRDIKIEDLLGRDEIQLHNFESLSNAHEKTIMVIGAAGSIGSELCRQLARYGIKNLVLYDNAETPMHYLRLELEDRFASQAFVPIIGDVRHERRLDFAFRTYKPDIVFHAAAYKHVPLMEENPCEAVLVNVMGSRNVAEKCLEYGVEEMIMISTDKAVNPTNIMGCTKRLAEIYVQSLGLAIEKGEVQGKTKFITTRFGNVLGSNGSVIPRFREQIAGGGPVTVTDPRINRFFMTIPEACRLVMEASVISKGNEICVFDMGDPVKIDDLARKMIELAGLTVGKDIKIIYTGLRPGEKLYEEVLSSTENTDPTSHDRIRVARVRQYEYASAAESIRKLEALAHDVNIPDMVILMKQIVPEFKSNNSRFSIYDKLTTNQSQ